VALVRKTQRCPFTRLIMFFRFFRFSNQRRDSSICPLWAASNVRSSS